MGRTLGRIGSPEPQVQDVMIDLHCHSIMSDGELIPSELVRRLEVKGYRAVAITDHADASNLDFIIPRIIKAAERINQYSSTKLIPGIELTHVHPELIGPLAKEARELGAKVVVCHGETLVEPVAPGTNKAALEADIDILAHPGLISEEEARKAAERGIFLELSGRKGHSLSNGHVLQMARKTGAKLVINSDGHAPGDFMSREYAYNVARGAGCSETEVEEIYKSIMGWIDEILKG
nr:histidinol phosphate phosphatase domain-containing protein [Dissulfuribacter thermophilus]